MGSRNGSPGTLGVPGARPQLSGKVSVMAPADAELLLAGTSSFDEPELPATNPPTAAARATGGATGGRGGAPGGGRGAARAPGGGGSVAVSASAAATRVPGTGVGIGVPEGSGAVPARVGSGPACVG